MFTVLFDIGRSNVSNDGKTYSLQPERAVARARSPRLGARWHDVEVAHFHTFARDAPFGDVEIELRPPRAAEFAGTNEDKRRQFQRSGRDGLSPITVDGAE